MIQTSRPGSLPAGLQGIWNGMIAAPWGNDYHSNINFQMIYWLPEVCNLSECHLPMLDYLNAMRKPFKENTQEYLKAIGESVNTTPDNDGWIKRLGVGSKLLLSVVLAIFNSCRW